MNSFRLNCKTFALIIAVSFLHGFSCERGIATKKVRGIIVLLSGLGGNGQVFDKGGLIEHIEEELGGDKIYNGKIVTFTPYRSATETISKGISEQADMAWKQVEEQYGDMLHDSKIILIGHSQGFLVGSEIIRKNKGKYNNNFIGFVGFGGVTSKGAHVLSQKVDLERLAGVIAAVTNRFFIGRREDIQNVGAIFDEFTDRKKIKEILNHVFYRSGEHMQGVEDMRPGSFFLNDLSMSSHLDEIEVLNVVGNMGLEYLRRVFNDYIRIKMSASNTLPEEIPQLNTYVSDIAKLSYRYVFGRENVQSDGVLTTEESKEIGVPDKSIHTIYAGHEVISVGGKLVEGSLKYSDTVYGEKATPRVLEFIKECFGFKTQADAEAEE